MEEILAHEPDDVREFLLRTSILDRLSSGLVDAVTGRRDGATMLRRLEQSNLFVTPLDEERRWYRYHSLFRDLLRSELTASAPDEPTELHQRASRWFEQAARQELSALWLLEGAIEHALAAREVQTAARLVSGAAGRLLGDNEQVTLVRWLARLPDELVRGDPRLASGAAWAAYLTGQRQRWVEYLEAGERALLASPPGETGADDEVRGSLTTLRAMAARDRLQFDAAIGLFREALDLFGARPTSGMVAAHLQLGTLPLRIDQLKAAEHHLHQAVEHGLAGANVQAGLAALSYLGALQVARGRLDEATDLAWLKHVRGDESGADGVLADGFNSVQALNPLDEREIVRARLSLARGQVPPARGWPERAQPILEGLPPGLATEPGWLMCARILIELGKPSDALVTVDRLLAQAEAHQRNGSMVPIRAVRASALARLGEVRDARETLQVALAIGLRSDYRRTFLDESEVPALLRQVAGRTPDGTPLSEELRAYSARLVVQAPAHPEPDSPHAPLPEALSARELEVLRLLAEGKSNQEIADTLIVGVATIKTHLHRAHTKLGAASRLDAVTRARGLGLLD